MWAGCFWLCVYHRVHQYLAAALVFSFWHISTTTSVFPVYFSQRNPFPQLQGAFHCSPSFSTWAFHLCPRFAISNLERSFLNEFILLCFVSQLVVPLCLQSSKVLEFGDYLGFFLSLQLLSPSLICSSSPSQPHQCCPRGCVWFSALMLIFRISDIQAWLHTHWQSFSDFLLRQ